MTQNQVSEEEGISVLYMKAIMHLYYLHCYADGS